MIKVLIAYIFYGIGHVLNKIMSKFDYWRLYPLYNWFMLTSIKLQGESRFGPWLNRI